jgi:hypothetical protein
MKLQLTYQFDNEDELRAHLGTETRTAAPAPTPVVETPVTVIPATTPVAVEEAPVEAEAERSASDLDGDGMPYDAAVHADPPSCTADGLWRAKRGKADEAKSARAAFKAKGGNVAAPAALPTALPGMPAALPGMPSALPADAPEPVSLERVIEKITGMIGRAKLNEQTLAVLYQKHSGVADPAASFGVFNTNESARANLFNELCDIEPEMA